MTLGLGAGVVGRVGDVGGGGAWNLVLAYDKALLMINWGYPNLLKAAVRVSSSDCRWTGLQTLRALKNKLLRILRFT